MLKIYASVSPDLRTFLIGTSDEIEREKQKEWSQHNIMLIMAKQMYKF
jgi:hypothetical protein